MTVKELLEDLKEQGVPENAEITILGEGIPEEGSWVILSVYYFPPKPFDAPKLYIDIAKERDTSV